MRLDESKTHPGTARGFDGLTVQDIRKLSRREVRTLYAREYGLWESFKADIEGLVPSVALALAALAICLAIKLIERLK